MPIKNQRKVPTVEFLLSPCFAFMLHWHSGELCKMVCCNLVLSEMLLCLTLHSTNCFLSDLVSLCQTLSYSLRWEEQLTNGIGAIKLGPSEQLTKDYACVL